MGWLLGPLAAALLTAMIGGAALLSAVTTRKPIGGALERLDKNTATREDMEALQGAGQDFVRSAQILRAGGSLIGSRGPIPNIGGGAAGRIVGGKAEVLGGAGVGAPPTGAESALGGVINRAIGSLATRASQPAQRRDNVVTTGRPQPAQGGTLPQPDIQGAIEAGSEFEKATPWGKPPGPTSGAAGGGPPIEQPGLRPQPGTEGPPTAGVGSPPGFGPVPGVMYPPPGGGPLYDPRIPWQGQVPPSGGEGGHGGGTGSGVTSGSAKKPSKGTTPSCGPATSCTCPDGKKGHISCETKQCHCGAG